MPQNLVEKIAQRHAVGLPTDHEVRAGDFLSIRPTHVMTHDNTAAVLTKFQAIGARRVHDPAQPVFALDHDIQNRSPENLASYARIQAFAAEQGIVCYPAGRGIGHQVMLEEGFVLPGAFVVASDSHANIYGALGALGTPVVRTDAAALWATGTTWWQVPPVVRVHLHGQPQAGVVGKDIILGLIGCFCHDEALNCCVEFTGPGVAKLDIEQRMTIANMTTEWGALAGIFPCDQVTRAYLHQCATRLAERGDGPPRLTPRQLAELEAGLPAADPDAVYARELEFDLSTAVPFVAGPDEVKAVVPISELERREVRIDKAYLMSCVNGRLGDFAAAAEVVTGRRVAAQVEFYIAAASSQVEEQARERGYWQKLLAAGARPLPPGCGACIGLGAGLLQPGEVGISATNRNFKGRMGSRDAAVYLASPAVVAASAVAGRIISPQTLRGTAGPTGGAGSLAAAGRCRQTTGGPARPTGRVELIAGFPERIVGELLLVPRDNLNTDGIYGKEYTYRELPPEEMARVAMANYDPHFQELARAGDILVGGYNFGSGSSREQAATALRHRGLQMIIAGSFSQTYKRNAFNNGYICLECPELVEALRAAFADRTEPTIRTGWQAAVEFAGAQIAVRLPAADDGGEQTATYRFSPLGAVAQELIVRGGLEALVREQLGRTP